MNTHPSLSKLLPTWELPNASSRRETVRYAIPNGTILGKVAVPAAGEPFLAEVRGAKAEARVDK